jgi:hypothetical protein
MTTGPFAMEKIGSGSDGGGGELEKTSGIKNKLAKNKFAAGLRKVSHEHLAELHHAVAGEMERRAKEHAKNKPPGQMSEKEFQQFARHHMGQSED